MDMLEKIKLIEEKIEQYQEEFDPEEKMDLKQTIKADIKKVKVEIASLPEHQHAALFASVADLEEVLEY